MSDEDNNQSDLPCAPDLTMVLESFSEFKPTSNSEKTSTNDEE